MSELVISRHRCASAIGKSRYWERRAIPRSRISRRAVSGSRFAAARPTPADDIPASISWRFGAKTSDAAAGERVRVFGPRREQVDLAPDELQRRADVVVVEADVDAHVAVGALPRDHVDAQLGAAPLQVPAVILSAALAGFDDPV